MKKRMIASSMASVMALSSAVSMVSFAADAVNPTYATLTELQDFVKEMKTFADTKLEDYGERTQTKFEKVLEYAERISNSTQSTPGDIAVAYAMLSEAHTQLHIYTEAELKALLADYRSIYDTENDRTPNEITSDLYYTEDTWEDFDYDYYSAQKLIDKGGATQKQITDAYEDLVESKLALSEMDTVSKREFASSIATLEKELRKEFNYNAWERGTISGTSKSNYNDQTYAWGTIFYYIADAYNKSGDGIYARYKELVEKEGLTETSNEDIVDAYKACKGAIELLQNFKLDSDGTYNATGVANLIEKDYKEDLITKVAGAWYMQNNDLADDYWDAFETLKKKDSKVDYDARKKTLTVTIGNTKVTPHEYVLSDGTYTTGVLVDYVQTGTADLSKADVALIEKMKTAITEAGKTNGTVNYADVLDFIESGLVTTAVSTAADVADLLVSDYANSASFGDAAEAIEKVLNKLAKVEGATGLTEDDFVYEVVYDESTSPTLDLSSDLITGTVTKADIAAFKAYDADTADTFVDEAALAAAILEAASEGANSNGATVTEDDFLELVIAAISDDLNSYCADDDSTFFNTATSDTFVSTDSQVTDLINDIIAGTEKTAANYGSAEYRGGAGSGDYASDFTAIVGVIKGAVKAAIADVATNIEITDGLADFSTTDNETTDDLIANAEAEIKQAINDYIDGYSIGVTDLTDVDVAGYTFRLYESGAPSGTTSDPFPVIGGQTISAVENIDLYDIVYDLAELGDSVANVNKVRTAIGLQTLYVWDGERIGKSGYSAIGKNDFGFTVTSGNELGSDSDGQKGLFDDNADYTRVHSTVSLQTVLDLAFTETVASAGDPHLTWNADYDGNRETALKEDLYDASSGVSITEDGKAPSRSEYSLIGEYLNLALSDLLREAEPVEYTIKQFDELIDNCADLIEKTSVSTLFAYSNKDLVQKRADAVKIANQAEKDDRKITESEYKALNDAYSQLNKEWGAFSIGYDEIKTAIATYGYAVTDPTNTQCYGRQDIKQAVLTLAWKLAYVQDLRLDGQTDPWGDEGDTASLYDSIFNTYGRVYTTDGTFDGIKDSGGTKRKIAKSKDGANQSHYELKTAYNNLLALVGNEDGSMVGDVNGDKKITSLDALEILEACAALKADTLDLKVADCNGDGKVTSDDALEILKYCATNV